MLGLLEAEGGGRGLGICCRLLPCTVIYRTDIPGLIEFYFLD